MVKYLKAIVAAVAAVSLAGPAQAQGKPKLYVGTLNCSVSGSVGFVFGSSKDLNCLFVNASGASELYQGTIKRFGVDIGFTKAAHVVWHVYTLGQDRTTGVLAGEYVGGQESAALGVGLGGNSVLGGRNGEILLSSVSVSGNAGFNFADGIAAITLQPSR